MKLDTDKIVFESRREIEAVMIALNENKKRITDDNIIKELYDKLEAMHMNW